MVTISFVFYYFITHNEKLHQYFIKKDGVEKSKISWIVFQRLAGVFFLGIVPIFLVFILNITFEEIGLTFKNKKPIWGWVLGLGGLCVLINYFACQKDDHLEMYPQIRTPQPWSKKLLFNSALTLFLYTLAYEVMFRGFLLFTCEKELGVVLAIVINTAIYALVHIPKGWKETVGAFPMGIVLCWLTLETGNIWVAVLVHVILAWSSEWFSIAGHKKKTINYKL